MCGSKFLKVKWGGCFIYGLICFYVIGWWPWNVGFLHVKHMLLCSASHIAWILNLTEGFTLIPRMPCIHDINTAWAFWGIELQVHECLPACYACFECFLLNMSILCVFMDMQHMGTWSSEWSKRLKNPELEIMNSCDPHVSTGNFAHLFWRPGRAQ